MLGKTWKWESRKGEETREASTGAWHEGQEKVRAARRPNLGEVGRRPFSATFSQEHRHTRFVSAPGAKATVTICPGVPRTQMTRRALTGNTSVGLARDTSREDSQPSVTSSHDPSSLSQPQYANAGQPTEVPYKFPLTFATCKMAPTIPPKPSPAMNPAAMA